MRSTPLLLAITAALTIALPDVANAGNPLKKAGNVVGKAVNSAGKLVGGTAKRVADTAERAVKEAGRVAERGAEEAERTGKRVGTALEDAGRDTRDEAERAGKRLAAEAVREVKDIGVAAEQAGKFTENQVRDLRDQVMTLESNIRNGELERVVGFGVFSLRNTSENASEAMQNSVILHAMGQMASSLAGPAGTGAFAAWYTLEATGNLEDALKAGALSGAASFAFTSISAPDTVMGADGVAVEVPRSLDAASVAQRSVATAAVAGLATTAAGGDRDDIHKAFLMGATTSLAADAYLATTQQNPDPRPASEPPYCKAAAPGLDCSPPADAWDTDPETGKSVVDVRRTNPDAQHVGIEGTFDDVRGFYIRDGRTAALLEQTLKNPASEGSLLMSGISQGPGVNAGAFFHDRWATVWSMPPGVLQITIPPAMILTAVATGAPMAMQITSVAGDTRNQ